MAPEQREQNGPIVPCTDVHGLGAVLYALLSGRAPFADRRRRRTDRQAEADRLKTAPVCAPGETRNASPPVPLGTSQR